MNTFVSRFQQIAERARRRYSIMVMSGPNGKLRQFSIPGLTIPLVAGICGLGLLGGGASLLNWTSGRVERTQLQALEHENDRLGRQLADIRETVELFETRMHDNLAREETFRNIANLDAIPDEVQRLGVGGPPPFSELSDESSPSPLIREARETLNRLEGLNRRANFQSSNLEEMVVALRNTQEDLDHLPSISPVSTGWFSSGYGSRSDPFTSKPTMHRGVDFSAATGTPVVATASGRVTKAGRHGTLGLMIEIDHGNGLKTRYGHNSRLIVKVGETVERGDIVAHVGSTGRSTSPHCHYEVHVNGNHVNPWKYILDGGPIKRPNA